MKFIRKAICFVSAITLALSLFVPAFATSYADDRDIQYNTEVGVLSGIGILSGYSDNRFRPSNTVTREEAAKMITYTLLGPTAASNLKYTKSSFSDVAIDRWSLPYIEWCAENGIISGRGNGTFDPQGNIASNEFAKMLLCAVGYGKKGEYTGTDWDYNATRDAFIYGIFDSGEGTITQKTTRQQAAVFIYNAITKIEMVKYDYGYVPADGTAKKDNTIAAHNFGLKDDSIITGAIEENSSNGVDGTKIGNTTYQIKTGRELLGHYVTIYTNGNSGYNPKVYYLKDESQVVTLKSSISDLEAFKSAFGYYRFSDEAVAVFDKDLNCTKKYLVDFYPDRGVAPAGTYVIWLNKIAAYFPLTT